MPAENGTRACGGASFAAGGTDVDSAHDGAVQREFWKHKPLSQFSAEEWEAVCDGCGRCCYRTFITGRGKKVRLHYTRIACDWLDVPSGRCTCYPDRFAVNRECTRLTKRNIAQCDWLPATCAYRLLAHGQPLPEWHPLVSGAADSVERAGIRIAGGIHERAIGSADWEEFEL